VVWLIPPVSIGVEVVPILLIVPDPFAPVAILNKLEEPKRVEPEDEFVIVEENV
jgi:hypothetical protein